MIWQEISTFFALVWFPRRLGGCRHSVVQETAGGDPTERHARIRRLWDVRDDKILDSPSLKRLHVVTDKLHHIASNGPSPPG